MKPEKPPTLLCGSVEGGLEGDAETLRAVYRRIGELAARLHNQAASWQRPPGFERHAWDVEGLVGERPLWGRFWELEALTAAQRSLLERARERVRQDLLAYGQDPATYGLIHADFVAENLLVEGDRVRLIDFDDAGYGWHLFEIATSLHFQIGEPYFEDIRAAVIEGYRAFRPLPDSQLRYLPLFFLARSFTYLGWVHTRRETQTARELTPILVDSACTLAASYVESRPRQGRIAAIAPGPASLCLWL